MKKTDYSKLTDSPKGRRNRQRKRRQALNEVAKSLGFETWGKLETTVINGKVELLILKNDDK
jgi:hypothetical protein